MPGKAIIRFVHEGKAAYPDVRAYMDYFGRDYETFECTPDQAVSADRLDYSVCWYMMGFYPRSHGCAVTVHDYRSLSVGSLRRTKDRIKRLLNARPDIRIFQNDAIRRALGFAANERTCFLPMGVPRSFIEGRDHVSEPVVDFIYIGSLLAERKCEIMLDSFLARFGASRSFDLYGPLNPSLQQRYADHDNIRFMGLIAQERLPAILQQARVGVCYFPMHYPHILQTPTKLMEYAALGMRILANDHPQSRLTAEQYGIRCLWGATSDMFEGIPDSLDWSDNRATDPNPMAWPSVIAASGIDDLLKRVLQQRFAE